MHDLQYRMGKPTIAAMTGPARAAGVTLAVSCDILIANEEADMSYPEINVGLIPAMHFVHLPKQIGRHKAFELLFTGNTISYREAAERGLINKAVPPDQVLPEARAMASELVVAKGEGKTLSITYFMQLLHISRNTANKLFDEQEAAGNIIRTQGIDAREVIIELTPEREHAAVENADGFIDIIIECYNDLFSPLLIDTEKPVLVHLDQPPAQRTIMIPKVRLSVQVYADRHLRDGYPVANYIGLSERYGIEVAETTISRFNDRPEIILEHRGADSCTLYAGDPVAILA